jgi:uncharacterized membrane protein
MPVDSAEPSEVSAGARGRTGSVRIASIDALRGAVMILMALDHTRDFLHSAAIRFDPEDLARTTAAIFLTRWITHFCAPVFMLTAGLGAWFWRASGRATRELSRFLLTRGVWLVLLELTALRLAYNFAPAGPVLLTILWAIGGSMVVLAALVHLPPRALAIVALAVVVLHDSADAFQPDSWLWTLLHQRGVILAGPVVVVVGYPLVPWFAVMALGFALGPIMALDARRRRRWLLSLGLATTAAFLVLRTATVYGDPQPWTPPGVLSFLRCTKYPPSLLFLLMTLGPALLALAWLDGRRFARAGPLLVFGRVPLFYFLLHLYLIHGLAVVLAVARYGHAGFLFGSPPSADTYPAGYGYPLWVVYLAWMGVVAACYPLCRWFAGVTSRRRDWWLSYL